MLNRAKIVLATLQLSRRPISSLSLFKLVFLLREEGGLSRVGGFYDFVPYRFGPYSFVLDRDLDALRRNGYVEKIDDSWRLGRLAGVGRDWTTQLDARTSQAVRFVVSSRGGLEQDDLLRQVYATYPWFASRSELTELRPDHVPPPVKADLAVYTAGYQQTTADGFLRRLLEFGIEAIIDIRANPVSRSFGFASRTIERLSGKLGLGYHHLPELGIPSDQRKGVETPAQFQKLFQRYRDSVLPERTEAIARVADLMRARPSTLLCYEADPAACHRRPLAQAVAEKSGLAVVDLPCKINGKQNGS